MTSVVTSPSPEAGLGTIEDLLRANYTMVFGTQDKQRYINATFLNFWGWAHTKVKGIAKKRIFDKLMDSSFAHLHWSSLASEFSWHGKLRNAEKIAVFGYAGFVMQQVVTLPSSLRKKNVRSTKCHVGQELEFVEMSFFLLISQAEQEKLKP